MKFKLDFDVKALEKKIASDFKAIEIEANEAASRHSTPRAKAEAFARVLRAHGVTNVDVAGLEAKFTP